MNSKTSKTNNEIRKTKKLKIPNVGAFIEFAWTYYRQD